MLPLQAASFQNLCRNMTMTAGAGGGYACAQFSERLPGGMAWHKSFA